MNQKSSQNAVESRPDVRRAYSSPKEFCMIFENDMDALYSLALLLTGEHAAAEACFLSALEDCRKTTDVFPEWARSWSRRAIVKNAIRRVNPGPRRQSVRATVADATGILCRLLELGVFQRFVFAMAVLEHYNVHECAALLNCDAREVKQARLQALRSLSVQELAPLFLHKSLGPQLTPAISAA